MWTLLTVFCQTQLQSGYIQVNGLTNLSIDLVVELLRS